ncbi:hypothetical protein [Mobilicoccus massiliensis]|uniref:hypothetical protein n=1 Tax=Mobilicoccus massiliensis TaxID=1522310 RepID=UPI00058C3F1E|nr:hypothetical protein [Mobilicoccus massiliensis]
MTRPIRRAVVAGGSGFLGSHLCTALRVSVVVPAARDRLAGARRLPPGVAAPPLPPADLEEILT